MPTGVHLGLNFKVTRSVPMEYGNFEMRLINEALAIYILLIRQ